MAGKPKQSKAKPKEKPTCEYCGVELPKLDRPGYFKACLKCMLR
jgi:hypothetical protein